jgi:polysaccharide export outer membrane protein
MAVLQAYAYAGAPRHLRNIAAGVMMLLLAACASVGASGPSTKAINNAGRGSVGTADIKIVDVTDTVAGQVLAVSHSALFSEALGDAPAAGTIIGYGDVLEVTIWEAPPAVLFGSNATLGATGTTAVVGSAGGTAYKTSVPELTVDDSGQIRIPFAGSIEAAGLTPQQIEREIVRRLSRKAHDPQVAVRLVRNASSNVTVVGEVVSSSRVPLTPRGERLLDVLAAAGGVKQPVGKTTIRVSRGRQVVSVPLERVIDDPAQNIRLRADDVVTALYQPFSFTSLGATGTSAEISFESTGLTLAQALGRVGGLREDRANIRGVFIFRLEDAAALDPGVAATARRTPDGRIPVIYRVDLHNPATLFIAQKFPIRDKDVLYVSNAPLSDLQRFVGLLSSLAFTAIGLGQAVP